MGAEAAALASAIGEFFDRRGDARAIAEAAATGSAVDEGRWSALCELGLPTLRIPAPDGIGATLLDSTAVAERFGAVLLPEQASASIVLANAVGQTDVRDAVLDGSRIAALAFVHGVDFDSEGSFSVRLRVPDDDVTALVAVPRTGLDGGIAIYGRSALGAALQHSDVDPSRPTMLCDLSGVVPEDVVPSSPEAVAATVREWTTLVAAELVGGMQEVLAATLRYAKERRQFGRSIGGFQAVKHQLADMYVAVEQARAAMQFAAISCDESAATVAGDVAAVARWVPMAAIAMFESAIHVHGAMGYSWETGVHLHLRRAVATRTLLRESRVAERETWRMAS